MKFKTLFIFIFALLFGFQVNAGIYDFKELAHDLGYPSSTYFGSSEEAVQDLETYTSKEDTFYKEINSYLRYFPKAYEWNGISPDDAKVMVKNIDQIFDHIPALPSDIILFRGLDLSFRQNKSYSTGEEFSEKAYVSTSTSFKVAKYFAVEMNAPLPGSKKAIIAYYVNRPNFKGILFDQGEDEIILQHGIKIRIMAMNNQNLNYDFYLAQICPEVCAKMVNKITADYWKNLVKPDN
jgi:hypothetical protein